MSPEPEPMSHRPDDLAAWRRAYLADLPEGSPACPGEEELAALVLGEVAGDARLRLADHLVACRRCAGIYGTLAELDREATAAPAGAGRGAASPRRRLVGWAAAAAALLVAAGLALFELPAGERRGEVVRGRHAAMSAAHPPHGARLAAPPRRLAWVAEEPGAIYRVVVYDAESVPWWESARTREPALALPAAVRDRLAAGGTFYWRVRIESERGASATPLYRFEVAR